MGVAAPARARPSRARQTRAAQPRRRRPILIALAVLALLGAAAYFWLRDSSLVSVDNTRIVGIESNHAEDIRAALDRAAQSMTTLNVDEERLENAVSGFPVVAGVEADPHIPHWLTIEVIEREPVATVEGSGDGVPVAADGTLLPDLETDRSVPMLASGRAAAGEDRLEGEDALAELAAAAAAPEALGERVETIEREGDDLVATIDGGPAVLLGDEARLDAKWAAAVAAIADGGAADASYLDVALPERPAAG